MNAYLKGGLVAALFILGLIAAWIAYSPRLSVYQDPEQYRTVQRMETEGVPSFELPDLEGKPFEFGSLRGKIVIVNFWASWCNPCVEEFPSLRKLIESHGGDLALVAVSADEEKGDIVSFLRAFGSRPAGMTVVWDRGRKIADKWGVGKIPESFVVDRQGKLIRKVIGTENWAAPGALAYFDQLLKETAAK